MKPGLLRLLVRWALITASLTALLYLAAGTTHVLSIRRYVAVFSSLLLVTMLSVDPRLAQERAHPRNAGIDGLRFAAALLFLLTLTAAALSVGRFPLSFTVPNPLRFAALAAFALSGSLQTWAMIVNPFFSPVVRLQAERSHRVVEDGPYRFMRHPGYFAMSIAAPTSAIALGSWIALVPAAAFVTIIAHRARIEDEFLTQNLSGYKSYAKRIRGGLFPRRRRLLPPSPTHLPANTSSDHKAISTTGTKHGYRI